MGAQPYWYIVPFDGDVLAALNALREREFHAGRYNPVIEEIRFPITAKSPSPGAKHKSIEAALEASGAEGTRSILDISKVSGTPGICTASPLSSDMLFKIYGTDRPTRSEIEPIRKLLLAERIERGHAIYVVIYASDRPAEILFAGYSFD